VWGLLLVAGALLSGCAGEPATLASYFQQTPETARHRAMQTRTFETTDEAELLSASAAALQDLGFQLEETSTELGILRAAKERGAREYGQEIRRVLILLASSMGRQPVMIPVDMHQQINATLVTRRSAVDPSRFSVRVLFHRSVWKGDGASGNTSIPPGQLSLEMIVDATIYQRFFAKLSKSVFLEAHEI